MKKPLKTIKVLSDPNAHVVDLKAIADKNQRTFIGRKYNPQTGEFDLKSDPEVVVATAHVMQLIREGALILVATDEI